MSACYQIIDLCKESLTVFVCNFTLCLQSVLHENVYRNPVAKHCYGDEPVNQL